MVTVKVVSAIWRQSVRLLRQPYRVTAGSKTLPWASSLPAIALRHCPEISEPDGAGIWPAARREKGRISKICNPFCDAADGQKNKPDGAVIFGQCLSPLPQPALGAAMSKKHGRPAIHRATGVETCNVTKDEAPFIIRLRPARSSSKRRRHRSDRGSTCWR